MDLFLIEILVHPSDTHISEVVLLLKQKLFYVWNKGLKMVKQYISMLYSVHFRDGH